MGRPRFLCFGGSDMTARSIDTTKRFDGDENPVTVTGQAEATGTGTGKPELRAAARRHGLTMKELAARMGVSSGYLSQIFTGRRPWTAQMRERAAAVLGEVPGRGSSTGRAAYGLVNGENSYIRKRARALGMSMQGPGGTSWDESQLHQPGVPWPQEHGRGGPGAGRGRAGGSGQG